MDSESSSQMRRSVKINPFLSSDRSKSTNKFKQKSRKDRYQEIIEKRARNKKIRKVVFWGFTIVQIMFLVFFLFYFSQTFVCGQTLCVIIMLVNWSAYMVHANIINSYVKPKNDPGILIWWLCCVRIGFSKSWKAQEAKTERDRKAKYATGYLNKQSKASISKRLMDKKQHASGAWSR